jgi:TPR repeat protein
LKNLFMYAPTDFVGVMHSAVDLRGADKKLIDRREVKLEWVERKKDPSRVNNSNAAANPAASLAFSKEASLTKDPVMNPVAAKDPVVTPGMPAVVAKDAIMSGETARSLMQRGQDSLKSGDIVTARMLFSRLAAAGIADAAFAAAQIYDPRYLAAHNVLGVLGDVAKADEFYQRAAQLGSTEAAAHLARIGGVKP